MGQVERPARGSGRGNGKLALRLEFAERAVRRQAGDGRKLLFARPMIVVRSASFQDARCRPMPQSDTDP